MKAPDFILVGESRCGSTSLYETLIQHPNICLPTPESNERRTYENGSIDLSQKELRFFDRHWGKGINWYMDRFPNLPGTLAGDASATYLYAPNALERIKTTVPQTKILILLRNPIERARSHFYHALKIHGPKLISQDFDEYVKSELKKQALETHHIIRRGIYIWSIKRCLNLFEHSQIKIIKSEDLFYKSSEVIIDVQHFLEIPEVPLKLMHLRKSQSTPFTPKTWEMLSEFYQPFNLELMKLIGIDFNSKIYYG